MLKALVCAVAAILISLPAQPLPAADQFELRDGDKVVLLGGAVIEHEQLHGYWETLLTLAWPDRNVTFRNLGWSGDTVWGESRGMFEPQEGYNRLIAHVKQEQPTVIIFGYGNNEAFGSEQRLEAFAKQLTQLTGDLAAEGRRFVFLSPLLMEAEQLPLEPSAAEAHARAYNRDLVHYCDVIRRTASAGGHAYIDLQAAQIKHEETDAAPLTDNGMRLTDDGYRQSARWLASHLTPGGNVDRLEVLVDLDLDTPAATKLREAIGAKNQLYFHRWRPQNFTYLFGFRKHEQGNNAVEIPQFDPLIAAEETEIQRLAQAVKILN